MLLWCECAHCLVYSANQRNVLKRNHQCLHRGYFLVKLLTETGLTSKTNLYHLVCVVRINTSASKQYNLVLVPMLCG